MIMSLGLLPDSTKTLVLMVLNGRFGATAIVNMMEIEMVVESQEPREGSRTIDETWNEKAAMILPRGVMGPAGVVSTPHGLERMGATKVKH